MVKINNISSYNTKFNFKKYSRQILSNLPSKDIIGIDQINFVDKFQDENKISKSALALYQRKPDGNKGVIEINISNLHQDKIPEYLFDSFPEIAGLILSEVLCHEVGHHVHHFRKHGIKKSKKEKFADKYAAAGYYHYLTSRFDKIMSSYKWASRNIFMFDKKQRHSFVVTRDNIKNWLSSNSRGIQFP